MFKKKVNQSAQNGGSASFRRNQTLNSYRSVSDNEPLVRKKTHELNRLRRKIMTILAGVIVIAIALTFLLMQFIGNITLTTDNDTTAVGLKKNAGSYDKIIADYFSKNPLERLNFVLRPNSLLLFIQQQAPEVANIELRDLHGIPGKAVLHLTFRKPIAKWTISGHDYYVDGAGETFTHNYFSQPDLTVVDENNLNVKQGVAIASNRLLETIGQSVNELDGAGFKVTKITIPRNTTRQFNISFDGLPYYAKLSTDRSAAEQAEDIKRAVGYLRLNSMSPIYIDVRITGKAYYK